ncbi:sodium:proton antiporter [Dorea formicigenerans]|nr:sodium:proton antiporter [Dorea formicigenerans]MCB8574546.1 sodium:proton antiporter [Dorea formicigenerans]MCG4710983.1 sodium:proton antiporter [Dorea formicigenerans]
MAFTICFLLLCIAVMPLLRAEWWEAHQPLVVFMWIILLVVPFAIVYGAGDTFETVLECIVNDYLTFIVLLFGLFCVSGNITVGGDFAGSPRVNACLLALGTLLSSCIGTTGASMLMVRPVIKMNSWRKRKRHIMVFFIFLISNMGGCLTPIGDPPLLMGFMRGVPFFWSMHLLPILIFNLVILLFVFYHLDKKAYRKDIAEGRKPDISRPGTEFYIEGLHNIILLAAFLSFKTTDSSIRTKNHFTWGAIKEVAVLFIGIFITMQPALMLLKSVGPNLGISEPYQMFWATGTLSSFLDNTPTYLVFLTTAGTLGLTGGITTALGQIPVNLLEAISCGAVFMGANTYIGNAPNFMVKAISDENGVNMPSFFGYILWSLAFLVPVFILDMLVFFL